MKTRNTFIFIINLCVTCDDYVNTRGSARQSPVVSRRLVNAAVFQTIIILLSMHNIYMKLRQTLTRGYIFNACLFPPVARYSVSKTIPMIHKIQIKLKQSITWRHGIVCAHICTRPLPAKRLI